MQFADNKVGALGEEATIDIEKGYDPILFVEKYLLLNPVKMQAKEEKVENIKKMEQDSAERERERERLTEE